MNPKPVHKAAPPAHKGKATAHHRKHRSHAAKHRRRPVHRTNTKTHHKVAPRVRSKTHSAVPLPMHQPVMAGIGSGALLLLPAVLVLAVWTRQWSQQGR